MALNNLDGVELPGLGDCEGGGLAAGTLSRGCTRLDGTESAQQRGAISPRIVALSW